MDGNSTEKREGEGQPTTEPKSTKEWVKEKFGEQTTSAQGEGKETNRHGNTPDQMKDKPTTDKGQSINFEARGNSTVGTPSKLTMADGDKMPDSASTNKEVVSITDSKSVHDTLSQHGGKTGEEEVEGAENTQESQEDVPMAHKARETAKDEDISGNVTVAAKGGDLSPRQTQMMRSTTSKGKARVPLQVKIRSRDHSSNTSQ